LGDAKISRDPQKPLLDYKKEISHIQESENVIQHIINTILRIYFKPEDHEAMRQRLS